MDEPLLGHPIAGKAGRDAVHIAIVPVTAAERLAPGTRVGIAGPEPRASASATRTIGIVDPYLRGPVFEGERFWLFLDPRTITSLRHVWTHPDFPAGDDSSEEWIRAYAESLSLSYQELMRGAKCWIDGGKWLCGNSNLEGKSVNDEFWDHYEIVTGTKVKNRESFFTCSC